VAHGDVRGVVVIIPSNGTAIMGSNLARVSGF
jgi:hypothetical protein